MVFPLETLFFPSKELYLNSDTLSTIPLGNGFLLYCAPWPTLRAGLAGHLPAKSSFSQIEFGVKLPAHRAGLPGNVDYDYTVGFPPRLPAYRQAGKAGHPADLPVNWGILMQHWARIEINKSDPKRS